MQREGQIPRETLFNPENIAAEFLRAQEVQRPLTIEELHQATESANDAVERVLFQCDRWRRMKEVDDGREGSPDSLYDEWIDVMLDLEETFIDENGGALGKHVLDLLALDDAAFTPRAVEARSILQQTTPMALRVYPFTHRLVDLGFGSSRADVVERLSSGDLVRREKVHNVSVTPRRRTIIGLLRDLDARLLVGERTDIWSLEVAPEFPDTAVIADPFQSGNDDLSAYWRNKIAIEHDMHKEYATVLSLSGNKTTAVIYELQDIAERAEDDVLRTAAGIVATWLEGKCIYYQDPDPRDFELYHLGMEDPQQLMEIMRSLDVMKHLDPELFFELIGIDPSQGGRSLYFGSFLHKALYNTQRALDHASPQLGTMALQTMMHQLLAVDERVQTYSAVVSQESLKAMAGEMQKSVDASETSQSKAQTLMMMAVPYSRMAVAAEVRRQLDAMREASSENIVEELRRRIDDIEHPLKLADYLAKLPRLAVDDYGVRRELRKILSEEQIENGVFRSAIAFVDLDDGVERYTFNIFSIAPELYKRIPLIDETREDLGFAMRIRVATRDAVNVKSGVETAARDFLKAVMPIDLYRVDLEAIEGGMGFWERRAVKKLGFAESVWSSRRGDGDGIHERRNQSKASQEDKAFFAGQIMVDALGSGRKPQDGFVEDYFTVCRNVRPDLIFLSVIAHPKGKEIAFKYFDKFCDMIPAERMFELLRHPAKQMHAFEKMFVGQGAVQTRGYLGFLRLQPLFISVVGAKGKHEYQWHLHNARAHELEILRKVNRVLVEGKTPWMLTVYIIVDVNHLDKTVPLDIDLWEMNEQNHWNFTTRESFAARFSGFVLDTSSCTIESLAKSIEDRIGIPSQHRSSDFILAHLQSKMREAKRA